MKQTNAHPRKRKNKGSLSVFDEFESDGAGSIVFKPELEQESLKKIEERALLADAPASFRSNALSEEVMLNIVQTSAKPSSEPSSNIVQTSAKPSSEPSSNIVQTSAKPSSKPSSEPSSNIVQTSAKPSSDFQFHKLSPIQQKLLLYLANRSQIERAEISPPLNGTLLANDLKCGLEGLRTAVKRLVKQGLLLVCDVKNGRTGWTQYRIPHSVFQTIVLNQTSFNSSSNIVQTSAKPSSKPSSEPSSNSSSSSSSVFNINNTTTTGAEENSEWDRVDFSAIADIGFCQAHIHQIASQKNLTPQQLQDSIDYFAFDIRNNGKLTEIKGNSLNFFMGILRKGVLYTPPENYESERNRSLRLWHEEKKTEQNCREKLQAELFELEFETWKNTLAPETKNQLVPSSGVVKSGGVAQEAMLKAHFRDNVWLEKLNNFLKAK